MGKERRTFPVEEKVGLLRRHFLEGVRISDLCDEHRLEPTVFYRWQKVFFENGVLAFTKDKSTGVKEYERRIEALETKLKQKDEVIAELLYDHVQLKKKTGAD